MQYQTSNENFYRPPPSASAFQPYVSPDQRSGVLASLPPSAQSHHFYNQGYQDAAPPPGPPHQFHHLTPQDNFEGGAGGHVVVGGSHPFQTVHPPGGSQFGSSGGGFAPTGPPPAFPFAPAKPDPFSQSNGSRSMGATSSAHRGGANASGEHLNEEDEQKAPLLTQEVDEVERKKEAAVQAARKRKREKLGSPLHRKLVNPFCDFVIDCGIIPRCISADALTLLGFIFCAAAASFASVGFTIVATLDWLFFSFADNLDGRQARRLGTDCPAGELLSRVLKAFASCFGVRVCLAALVPTSMNRLGPLLYAVCGQIPFYMCSLVRHHRDRSHFIPELCGGRFFTADEFNLIALPAVCIVARLTKFWNISVYTGELPAWLDANPDLGLTIGMCMVLFAALLAALMSLRYLFLNLGVFFIYLMTIQLLFSAVVVAFKIHLLNFVPCFAILMMEVSYVGVSPKASCFRYFRVWWPTVLVVWVGLLSHSFRDHSTTYHSVLGVCVWTLCAITCAVYWVMLPAPVDEDFVAADAKLKKRKADRENAALNV